jgi:hypothetical protein
VNPETIAIPQRAAFWLRLPTHQIRVYLGSAAAPPTYPEVFARGFDWPSLASAVTALEVNAWCEMAQPKGDEVALEKTA